MFPFSIFIFGGFAEKGKVIDEPQIYSILEEKFYSVKRKFSINGISGGVPEPRALFSMVHVGSNVITLYGGINANN